MTLKEKVHYTTGFVLAALLIISVGGYLATRIFSEQMAAICILLLVAYLFTEKTP